MRIKLNQTFESIKYCSIDLLHRRWRREMRDALTCLRSGRGGRGLNSKVCFVNKWQSCVAYVHAKKIHWISFQRKWTQAHRHKCPNRYCTWIRSRTSYRTRKHPRCSDIARHLSDSCEWPPRTRPHLINKISEKRDTKESYYITPRVWNSSLSDDDMSRDITSALLQRSIKLKSRGARLHPGLLQTRITTLRVDAKRFISGASVR